MKTGTYQYVEMVLDLEEYQSAIAALDLCTQKLSDAGANVVPLATFRKRLALAWDTGSAR